ncbi:MAG: type II toxin-antitoxin system VapC family toxin [Rhodocyclaceae bacterium]|nr:type II toxin-antitoxin system VapC family toxin [Rhodocyclaceae bacterium]
MILADTSIWIDHLRNANGPLTLLLHNDMICCHPWVVGELACGHLKQRENILDLLRALPTLMPATENEVLHFIELRRLMGRGIGYIDAHLLAACTLHTAKIWTDDKRLMAVSAEVGLAYRPTLHSS